MWKLRNCTVISLQKFRENNCFANRSYYKLISRNFFVKQELCNWWYTEFTATQIFFRQINLEWSSLVKSWFDGIFAIKSWHFYSRKKSFSSKKKSWKSSLLTWKFPYFEVSISVLESMNLLMQIKCEKYSLFLLNFNPFSARGSAEGSAEPSVKYTEPVRFGRTTIMSDRS